jgi:hypothetical protein
MSGRDLSDEEILAKIDGEGDSGGFIDHLEVHGASGTCFFVMGEEEKQWFESNMASYRAGYKFEDIADLQDLDRLLGLELLSYRYTAWLVKGSNYEGMGFIEKDIRSSKDSIDKEIRVLKSHMGMDRKHRMTAESESVADYLRNLKQRAYDFGVHRDNQIAVAIDLFNELKKMVGLHDRMDEEERRMLGVSQDEIFEWIRTTAIPRYDEIDDSFRKNQKLWIREVSV